MALRKIYIAVECANDEQRDRVQRIAEEISSMRVFDGNMIEGVYPTLRAKQSQISGIIQHIKANGIQGVKSVKFLTLIGELIR